MPLVCRSRSRNDTFATKSSSRAFRTNWSPPCRRSNATGRRIRGAHETCSDRTSSNHFRKPKTRNSMFTPCSSSITRASRKNLSSRLSSASGASWVRNLRGARLRVDHRRTRFPKQPRQNRSSSPLAGFRTPHRGRPLGVQDNETAQSERARRRSRRCYPRLLYAACDRYSWVSGAADYGAKYR